MIGTIALIPAHVDYLLQEVVLKATSLVVLAVQSSQLDLLFPLRDAVETEVVDDALEVASTDEGVPTGEVLE